jgi:3alpha(or 20beta)-hydroxysteroid dehydrogenase
MTLSSPESLIITAADEFTRSVPTSASRRPMDDRTWDRLDGRVALITGGARGIGEAQVRLFAAEGACVVITDILEERGEKLAEEIGKNAIFARLDVGRDSGWDSVLASAAEAFGPIDTLVHNAAIAPHGLIENMPVAEFADVLNINLTGAYRAIKACIDPMVRAGGGAMVITSSVESVAAHAAFSAYCTAKAGLLGLVRTAALELAPQGIRVNALCPGIVDTEIVRPPGVERSIFTGMEKQIPLGRVADPADMARVAMFLVSDDSRYVSGTSVIADGGVMARVPMDLG